GGGNVIAIRQTDSSGQLIQANYPSGTTNNSNGQAWMQAADDTALGTIGAVSEPIKISWAPDSTTAPVGYTHGTLTFSLTTSNNYG
ncbi:hypothetical protein L0P10_18055, partial [Eggerthella lenta]|nr:hypothetical protein [Eggerthella lenta]